MSDTTSRRSFLKAAAITGVASAVHPTAVIANDFFDQQDKEKIKNLIFLFQGDSITDGNRGRNTDPNHIMGHGYAFSVASRIGADFAESDLAFYNRGISGNKITDLASRWKKDALDIKPDVLSILIGINDASAMIKEPEVKESSIDQFENTYRDILLQSRKQNPELLVVLCLPFVYSVAKVEKDWEKYYSTVARLKVRVNKLAIEFNAVVVDFPSVFDKAIKRKPVEYWIWDGIHPTVPAHELMAREWIKQAGERLKFLRKYKR